MRALPGLEYAEEKTCDHLLLLFTFREYVVVLDLIVELVLWIFQFGAFHTVFMRVFGF